MTTNLSDDLWQAIEQAGGNPVHLVDAATNVHYVLMRADQYERVKALVEHDDQELDPRAAYPFVDRVMRDDDADDPTLDSYQTFTKREPRSREETSRPVQLPLVRSDRPGGRRLTAERLAEILEREDLSA